jgi:hypothetical protein
MDKKGISITAVVRVAILIVLAMGFVCIPIFAQNFQERFKDGKKLVYKVSANGIPSGYVEWEYLGRQKLDGKLAEVLAVSSDTNIFKFLNLTSNEKVFLDSSSHLPLRVERDVILFGKKEFIEEVYNQDEGYVKIKRSNDNDKENTLYRDKPIHNILDLLYFFPEDIDLEKGDWMTFNLPTQKVRIKFIRERVLAKDGQRLDTYFLIGRGAKRFSLWLDKESRLPLRIDFIFPLGKVIIESQS